MGSFLENVALAGSIIGSVLALAGAVLYSVGSYYKQPQLMTLTFPNGLPVDGTRPEGHDQKPLDRAAFETEALANYYNHALRRANISFAFSLIFAAIGFIVIVYAIGSYDPADKVGAIIRVLSGVVIDAVAALFFAQSNRAQASMQSFFEKLRVDRASAQAMALLTDIENPDRRDELRAQFIRRLADIDRLIENVPTS